MNFLNLKDDEFICQNHEKNSKNEKLENLCRLCDNELNITHNSNVHIHLKIISHPRAIHPLERRDKFRGSCRGTDNPIIDGYDLDNYQRLHEECSKNGFLLA